MHVLRRYMHCVQTMRRKSDELPLRAGGVITTPQTKPSVLPAPLTRGAKEKGTGTKPNKVGLFRRGRARERAKFLSVSEETEKSGLCKDETRGALEEK